MASRERPERKYALTKIAAGDYLLPSNDGKTMWRITTYTEGPSSGIDAWPRDKQVWGIWKWMGPVGLGSAVDTEDWSRWDFFDGLNDTRQAAIDAALKLKGTES